MSFIDAVFKFAARPVLLPALLRVVTGRARKSDAHGQFGCIETGGEGEEAEKFHRSKVRFVLLDGNFNGLVNSPEGGLGPVKGELTQLSRACACGEKSQLLRSRGFCPQADIDLSPPVLPCAAFFSSRLCLSMCFF